LLPSGIRVNGVSEWLCKFQMTARHLVTPLESGVAIIGG